jgi:hypothetical protein
MANSNDLIDKQVEVQFQLLELVADLAKNGGRDITAIERLKAAANAYAIVASQTPQNVVKR